MTFTTKLLASAAGIAALAAAAPAAAQYYSYPYNSYGYANAYDRNPYAPGTQYGYGYANPYDRNPYVRGAQYGAVNTNVAAQQCSAAVQQRLYNRQGISSIIGALLGANTTGRVLSITQVNPRPNGQIRIRGLASSGRTAYNNYGPYGVGAYGALGYNYANAADLSFRCDVYPNGVVRNVDINRR
jgi:hypothetical protein